MKHIEPVSPSGRRIVAHIVGTMMVVLAWASPVAAQMPSAESCGGISNGDNGPFDYRNERRDLLRLAELNHFTPKVQNLISGQSRYDVGGDLNFILRAFPNHPRALMAMMRWGEKLKTLYPPDTVWSVECYFERALRFRPDDAVVRMIYAMFLSRNGRAPEASLQLDRVAATAGDNSFTHYNAGLLYFEIRQYDKALTQAHTAMALGFPRTDLREQLRSVGKWTDAPEAAGQAAPAASSASAAGPS